MGAFGVNDDQHFIFPEAGLIAEYFPTDPVRSIYEHCSQGDELAPAGAAIAVSFLLATTTLSVDALQTSTAPLPIVTPALSTFAADPIPASAPTTSTRTPPAVTSPVSAVSDVVTKTSQAGMSHAGSTPPPTLTGSLSSQNVVGVLVSLLPSLSTSSTVLGSTQSIAKLQSSTSTGEQASPSSPVSAKGSTASRNTGATLATLISSSTSLRNNQGSIGQAGSASSAAIQISTLSAAIPPVVVAGSIMIAGSSGEDVVVGQTLAPGTSITLGSGSSTTIVALLTSHSHTILQVGTASPTQTQATISSVRASSRVPIVIAGSTATASSSGDYIVAGQTLQPGSSITIGSGVSTTVIALQTDASHTVLQVDSSISTLQSATISPVVTSPPTIVVGSSTITAGPSGDYVISGQTLYPGSSINIGSTSVALHTSGSKTVLVVGTSTSTVSLVSTTSNAYSIAGTTIFAGGSAVLQGDTTYSALPSGSGVLVAANGVTSTIQSGESSSGLGGYIYSGLLPASSSSSGYAAGSTVKTYTGAASKNRVAFWATALSLGVAGLTAS